MRLYIDFSVEMSTLKIPLDALRCSMLCDVRGVHGMFPIGVLHPDIFGVMNETTLDSSYIVSIYLPPMLRIFYNYYIVGHLGDVWI